MTSTIYAKAKLEGFLVTHVGSADAEEALGIVRELLEAEREACAKIAETMDYSVADLGPEAAEKVFSGITTMDNRCRHTPQRIADAIRKRGS